MTGPRTYPHGVPCWIDTEQPDIAAGRRVYEGLFGWTLTEAVPPGVVGSYLIATLDGQDVAAIAPGSGPAAAWNTYIAVDDADTAARRVEAHGGRVLSSPADAGPGGRTATCEDPAGAEFRLWQARRRPGAQLVNAPGGWNFSNLRTADPDASLGFYIPVFGWKALSVVGAGTMLQVPGYGDHLAATVDPGIHERQAAAPPGFADVVAGLEVAEAGASAGWHVCFTVADRDASAATAQQLGATVLASAETPWTRTALVRDPQGAELTLSQFTPPDDW